MSDKFFKEYSSIENSYQEKFINSVKLSVNSDESYIIMEKIHGSNLSVVFDESLNYHFASRESILDPEKNFFNENKIFIESGLINNLKSAAKDIFNAYSLYGFDHIQFVGEVFGGSYPNIKSNDAIKIQKGVYYSPENHWAMFDILLTSKNNVNKLDAVKLYEERSVEIKRDETTGELVRHPNFCVYEYINHSTHTNKSSKITLHIDSNSIPYKYLTKREVIFHSDDRSIPLVPIVGVSDNSEFPGKALEKALEFDVSTLESQVYKNFNLPKVEGNIAEGIVISPYDGDYRTIIGKRVVIKKKTEKFKEVSHNKAEYVPVQLPESIREILENSTSFLTEERVNSAISKHPESDGYEGRVIGSFTKDVFNEVMSDEKTISVINTLDNEVKNQFKRELNKMTVGFVKKFIFGGN